MSYVAGGKTYDEGGNEIDAFGAPLGGQDPNKSANQPKSAGAAAMGGGTTTSGGASIEDYNKAHPNGTFGAPAPSPYLSGGSSYNTAPSPGNLGPGGANVAAPVDPRLNQLFDELKVRSGQSLVVDPNDPTIKATTDAASVAGQRSLLKNQQQFAERGGPYATGATANNARMGAEALGTNLQGITATAMMNEVAARRAEIQSALAGQFGILSLQDQDRLKQEDQALVARGQDLTKEQNTFTNGQSAQQQAWMQQFQEKGFTADQALNLWNEMFKQQQADTTQSNTVWDQNWKLSGGA